MIHEILYNLLMIKRHSIVIEMDSNGAIMVIFRQFYHVDSVAQEDK